MRTGLAILTAVAITTACDRLEWQLATYSHTCTAEQMTKVQAEAEWCDKHTGYSASYCYGTSIIRNCTPKVDKCDRPS